MVTWLKKDGVKAGFRSCIFIMADGARDDIFSELLKRGDLPNISKYVVEKGDYRKGVSTFPSTTGPAYAPYLLGKFPGRCNLPGIRWFDRKQYPRLFSINRFRSYISPESYLMNSDVTTDNKSLFEIFSSSFSIFNELSRGVSFGKDKTFFSKLYYKVKGHFTDKSDEVDTVAQRLLLKCLKDRSEFVYVVFLGIDTYSHFNHPFHRKVIQSYIKIDDAVGVLSRYLEGEGRLEETLIVVASDHGLTQSHSHFDSLKFMNAQGYKTFSYPNVFKHFTNANAATMVSGNAMANIYVKSQDGWQRKSTFDELSGLVDNLLERPEVDIVAGIDDSGRARVKSVRGEASAWLDAYGKLRYEEISGDPFGYEGIPESMDMNEGLLHTYNTEYPDAPLQIVQLMEAPRSGDLVLSASKGYDLRARHENPEHHSSHGALFRDHMIVPILINTKISEGLVRTVDVYPTLVNLLGYPVPEGIDGVKLVDN